MVQDVRAARRFLASRTDVTPSRIGIAGASIGATLAALAAADDPSVVEPRAAVAVARLSRRSASSAAVRKYGARPLAARRERRRWVRGAVGAGAAEGGRRRPRSGRAQPRRPRHGDAGERCRSRPPPAGVVPTNAAMIESRSSRETSQCQETQSFSASPACFSASSSAGSSAASRAARAAPPRLRPRPSSAADARASDGGAARRVARGDARCRRAERDPRDVPRARSSSATSISTPSASRMPRAGTSRRSRSSRAT